MYCIAVRIPRSALLLCHSQAITAEVQALRSSAAELRQERDQLVRRLAQGRSAADDGPRAKQEREVLESRIGVLEDERELLAGRLKEV